MKNAKKKKQVTIKRNKWKLFGHVLRLPLYTSGNELIKYYFKVPEKLKKYPGIPRTRLPRSIDKDIKQAVKKSHPTVLPVKQFISTKGLEDLRMLA